MKFANPGWGFLVSGSMREGEAILKNSWYCLNTGARMKK
jgi:glucan-binding YG repeat protein